MIIKKLLNRQNTEETTSPHASKYSFFITIFTTLCYATLCIVKLLNEMPGSGNTFPSLCESSLFLNFLCLWLTVIFLFYYIVYKAK